MLIDIVQNYGPEKTQHLLTIRQKIIDNIARQHDHKKILSFLNKCGVIGIDEKNNVIQFGIPNEFVLSQVKKFFHKPLMTAIKDEYNATYKAQYHVYPPFQKQHNELLINLKKHLNISSKKDDYGQEIVVEALYQNGQHTQYTQQGNKKCELIKKCGITFDPKYTFDTFVVGAHDNFAFSAAKAVAENPGLVYNPLFIYGNVGLGKTHLMQAIANHIKQEHPTRNVLYLPTSKLIDEIVMSIRKNKLTQMMQLFDDIDVLLLDDIQFLADKDKTQEIFHNIFNDFHMKKKQVIITSDRAPKELNNIEARLKSRFSLGLVTDIQTPDYETRIAILQAKLAQKEENIDFDLLAIIANQVKDNIRELEGALNILITRKSIMGGDLGESDMYECLKTLGYSSNDTGYGNQLADIEDITTMNTRGLTSFSKIVDFVSTYYNLTVSDIKSESRTKEISQARQMLMVIAKKQFNRTLEKIGDYFGGKNHATVIYALKNFTKKMKHDRNLSHDYNVIMEQLEK